MENGEMLLETTRVSRSRSLRISLPKRVAERMDVSSDDIIGFYMDRKGEIIIKRLR